MRKYRNNKASWPMTLSELKARHAECNKEENFVFALFIPAFFVFLFLCVASGDFVEAQGKWIENLVIISFFGILIGITILIFKNIFVRRRAYGLVCPHCGKFLIEGMFRYAVKHGNCGKCFHQLIVHDELDKSENSTNASE